MTDFQVNRRHLEFVLQNLGFQKDPRTDELISYCLPGKFIGVLVNPNLPNESRVFIACSSFVYGCSIETALEWFKACN